MSWMRTGDAAHHLGISTDTLKRKMESKGGFLENTVHYNLGPSKNSAIPGTLIAFVLRSISVAFRLALSRGCLER